MNFAEIILPLPLPETFTYEIPPELIPELAVGSRVIVQFGKRKVYTGIIAGMHEDAPANYNPKEITDVLDTCPVILSKQLTFFEWMSGYYLCTLGEVINAALPAALKLSSESFISIREGLNPDELDLDDRERALLQNLQSTLSLKEAGDRVGLKYPQKTIKGLSDRGIVDVYEKVKDRYRPKKVKRVRLAEEFTADQSLEMLLNQLEKKPKQQEVILAYLRDIPILKNPNTNEAGLEKSKLTEDISASSLNTLIKRGVLIEWEQTVSRLPQTGKFSSKNIQLNENQEFIFNQLKNKFDDYMTVLLHGVTGSGKTEIYISLIREIIDKGQQVLYLLPEIALTTQIISRLQLTFGDTFGIYHSRCSDNERAEVWQKVLNKEYRFVIGVRSTVFLPFSDLGLIIVDEEHEPSYKQFEPAPRYHARDAAIYLATVHKTNVLLGTATPALETYQNALEGKYGLVELTERHGDSTLPQLHFADLGKARKQKKLRGNFTWDMVEAIEKALADKEQVILFQNRRGYAAYVSCDDCGYVPKCPNCAVSLTYHQYNNKLVCHYCGHHQGMFADCTSCGSTQIKNIGFGTEELEEELEILFPAAVIQRMDLDTARSKNSYQRIIEGFEEGHIDILVGTQMVSKGLDFGRVNLVGIFDTDRMIHFPDFRSHERAYHLITQVSGRAGRRSAKGKVVVQTSEPDHQVLEKVRLGDYRFFYQWEINERERFKYPPFTRLIKITFKHRDKTLSSQGASFFAQEVRKRLGTERTIGPVEPLIGRIRNNYLHEITLKIEKHGINLPTIKEFLKSTKKMMRQVPAFRSVVVVFDVDPI